MYKAARSARCLSAGVSGRPARERASQPCGFYWLAHAKRQRQRHQNTTTTTTHTIALCSQSSSKDGCAPALYTVLRAYTHTPAHSRTALRRWRGQTASCVRCAHALCIGKGNAHALMRRSWLANINVGNLERIILSARPRGRYDVLCVCMCVCVPYGAAVPNCINLRRYIIYYFDPDGLAGGWVAAGESHQPKAGQQARAMLAGALCCISA